MVGVAPDDWLTGGDPHHPIGFMSWNPEHNRQDAIETACHNAIRAMHDQATIAHRDGRSPEACLILAAALNQLVLQDITGEQLTDCIVHLTRQASPRRGDK